MESKSYIGVYLSINFLSEYFKINRNGGVPDMFPERPRGPKPILPPRPQQIKRKQIPNKSSLLSSFQNDEGDMDIDKVMVTGKKIMDVYNQVSPYFSKFIKR
ncbi:hypothetical protein D8M05_14255 [Oceanobacillus bengalensis]|uniref:Uncharacterized protein n=2 Tax=Oceanobacillus bengalensis TaxID=1435466 RepID=A0A494YVG7_9BACI|nr:hypothetical protein D8M05_14255 [Oceanobacillus bengalensis]